MAASGKSNSQKFRLLRSLLYLAGWLMLLPIFGGNIAMLIWSPPQESDLLRVEGRFVAHDLVACAGKFCVNEPYVLITQGGGRLELNCEPGPSINQCLDSDGYGHRTRVLSGLQGRVAYYDDNHGRHAPYLVMLSADIDGKRVREYREAVASIRNSSLSSDEYNGDKKISDRSYLPGSPSIAYYILIGYAILGAFLALNFLFNLVSFAFVSGKR